MKVAILTPKTKDLLPNDDYKGSSSSTISLYARLLAFIAPLNSCIWYDIGINTGLANSFQRDEDSDDRQGDDCIVFTWVILG